MPLTLGLQNTHVLVTGGAGLIGTAVVRAFLDEGAHVSSIDIAAPPTPVPTAHYYAGDVTDEGSFEAAWADAVRAGGPVACCVALASLDLSVLPHHARATETLSLAQFRRTLDVNVVGTWLAARAWLRGVRAGGERRNACLVVVGSESGRFGERGNPDYASAKSAVQGGLVSSLAAEAGREGVRVNAVAPGPVDTPRFKEECKNDPEQLWLDAQATTGLAQPVPMEAVANSILFLASDNFSSHIHGQVLNVDSGKQGKLLWTKEQIEAHGSGQS
ncbi:hypothetical protein SLS57_008576 [Botryosphaeria dothidea]